MRSARPAEAATNTTSSCWSRARCTSAIQSGTRPLNSMHRLTGDVLRSRPQRPNGRAQQEGRTSVRPDPFRSPIAPIEQRDASRSRTVSGARNSRDGGAIDSGDAPRVRPGVAGERPSSSRQSARGTCRLPRRPRRARRRRRTGRRLKVRYSKTVDSRRRSAADGTVGLAETLPNGHDAHLVDRPRRTLRGRVVAADRLHRVADELDAHAARRRRAGTRRRCRRARRTRRARRPDPHA